MCCQCVNLRLISAVDAAFVLLGGVACSAFVFACWSSPAFDFFILVEFAMLVINFCFHFMPVVASHSDLRPALNSSLQFNFISN